MSAPISQDEAFLGMAFAIAARSPCKRLQVGAVVASLDGMWTLGAAFNEHDRDCDANAPGACGVKVHAEILALLRTNAPVYVEREGLCVYATHMPCADCARGIVNDGRVKRVVYREPYRAPAIDVLRAAGIEIVELAAPPDPKDWLLSGDTGSSSEAIWHHMMGTKGLKRVWTPADSGDFGRCFRLLRLFPEWRARLGEMRKYPAWKPIVDVWPLLETLLIAGKYERVSAEIRKAEKR